MHTIAVKNGDGLGSGTTPLSIQTPLEPVASVSQSFAYRSRMRITALFLGLGLILTAMNRPLAPQSDLAEWGLELMGWIAFVGGAALRVWAASYICARKSSEVVSTGPYSVCRNPLYWGTFLMVAAIPCLLRSPVLAVSMIPPILLYLFAVVPVEEAVMTSRHGSNYALYCQSVSRWWPNILGYTKGEALGGQTLGYAREWARMAWWIGLAIGFDVLFHFSNQSWWMPPLSWW